MATDIDIASNALVLVGDEPINSFNDEGAGATAARNLYPSTKRMLLAHHPWSFALKEQNLNQTSQQPDQLTDFRYAYQIPPDTIKIWRVMPQSWYVIVGQFLYSNSNELLMRYTHDVDESLYPDYYQKTLEHLLAREFAQLVTENTSKSQYFAQTYKDNLASAMATDSQNAPEQPIIDSPFVDVRYSGGFSDRGLG